MYRHILVANDLTEASQPALRTALGLARALGANVTVLHVSQPVYQPQRWFTPFSDRDVAYFREVERREAEAAQRLLEEQVAGAAADADADPKAGAPVRVVLRSGAPSEVIVATARDVNADLIVMGTHGRKGLPHLLLGSVAERVLRTASCPVLTVAPGAH